MSRARCKLGAAVVVAAVCLALGPAFLRGVLADPTDIPTVPLFARSVIAQEMAIKISRVVALIKRRNLGGMLISRRANIAWLTAGQYVPRCHGSVFLLVLSDGARLVLGPSGKVNRLVSENLYGYGWEAHGSSWTADDPCAGLADLVGTPQVGTDVPRPGDVLLDRDLARLRVPLTDSEVVKYRWVGRQAAVALEGACRQIHPGMREDEIAALADASLTENGLHVDVVTATADKRLRQYGTVEATSAPVEHDVSVDATVERWGLHVSLVRSVHFGPVPNAMVREYVDAVQVFANLSATLHSGLVTPLLFPAMVRIYTAANAPTAWDLREVGGATGYASRDWTLRPTVAETMIAPQAFVWRPTVGRVTIEETVLMLDNKVDVLTVDPASGWPLRDTYVQGKDYPSADILVVKK